MDQESTQKLNVKYEGIDSDKGEDFKTCYQKTHIFSIEVFRKISHHPQNNNPTECWRLGNHNVNKMKLQFYASPLQHPH